MRQITESVTMRGNGGNDILKTGDGADTIDGGVGDDEIDGGFGDDTIVGGPGRDRISADTAGGDCGPLWCKLPYGNDSIDARDGEIDSIACGFGTDTVLADSHRRRQQGLRDRHASPGAPAPARPGTRARPARARRRSSPRSARSSCHARSRAACRCG